MSGEDPAELLLRLPPDARASELEVGGNKLRVISFGVSEPELPTPVPLSPAELEVAELVIQGLSNAEIAGRRGRRVRTVANQMAAIFKKLGVGSRRELAARHLRAPFPRGDRAGPP